MVVEGELTRFPGFKTPNLNFTELFVIVNVLSESVRKRHGREFSITGPLRSLEERFSTSRCHLSKTGRTIGR